MAPRTLNRPRPRSPDHKENVEDEPGYKRRHVAAQKLATHVPRNPSRSRQPMSELNSTPDSTPGDAPACPDAADKVEFASREDVERLLSEKMKGKGKSDFKGKCDQMMEYIKRLRSCIKWFEELEDGYLIEREKLHESIEVEKARCAEMESLKNRIEDALNAKLEELKIKCDVLRDKLEKEECGRLIAMESHDQEKEARKAAEASINALNTDMQKALQEVKDVKQQIKSIEDINKRLQEYNTSLQHYNSRLQNDAATQNEANAKLQKEKSSMMEALSSLRSHSNLLQEQLNSSKTCQQDAIMEKEELKGTLECLRAELQHVRNDRNLQIESVQTLKAELADFKERAQKTLLDLEMLISKTDVLEGTCSSQRDQINKLQSQLDYANAKLQMADSSVLETTMVYEEQKKEVQDLKSRLAEAELKIIDGEKLRKKLHNTIQELKGNIRVFCRVRPLFHDHDFSGIESSAVSYPTLAESLGRGIDLLHNNKKHSFTFDKVFDHEASQQDIFVEISQLVQSALDGYKVCIFAYGQTGSGKTYTMMGKQESPELRGLIPRSLEQIFQTSQSLSSHGWAFKMQASMLEIYNETIRDLLVANRTNCPETTTACGKQYTIKHDRNGNTHVSDLTVVDVSSIKEVSYLLKEAAQSRSIGRTQMNEQSSRSHFVFILRISGVNENTGQLVHGVLNLIDLAGSERLDKSGATGDRLKETQHINKSLLSLSDVISAIAKKEEHIPFRNSKLTYLLQPCLGGESKTLMFVNISPESSSTGESKCSLQFASKVNSCEIGVAHRNAQMRYTD